MNDNTIEVKKCCYICEYMIEEEGFISIDYVCKKNKDVVYPFDNACEEFELLTDLKLKHSNQ